MHILSMEINDTHGPRHLYWANENELFPNMKNISNPTSKIAIDLELNWGKDIISGKDDVPEYGANNILPNHVMALTDVLLLAVGLILSSTNSNSRGRVCVVLSMWKEHTKSLIVS